MPLLNFLSWSFAPLPYLDSLFITRNISLQIVQPFFSLHQIAEHTDLLFAIHPWVYQYHLFILKLLQFGLIIYCYPFVIHTQQDLSAGWNKTCKFSTKLQTNLSNGLPDICSRESNSHLRINISQTEYLSSSPHLLKRVPLNQSSATLKGTTIRLVAGGINLGVIFSFYLPCCPRNVR